MAVSSKSRAGARSRAKTKTITARKAAPKRTQAARAGKSRKRARG